MNKIKILFTIPNFISAGSGREMVNIIEHLDKSVFDISIAVQNEGGSLYYEVKSKGYKILVQPFFVDGAASLFSKVVGAVRLANTFTKYHYDIWQSFNWSSDFTEPIVARLAGAKFCYVKKNMNWDRNAWKLKSVLSNRIIARNTTMIEKLFSHWMYRKKTKLITGGVDTAKFIQIKNSNVRDIYNIPRGTKLVLCIAQLVRLKDHLTLVKAVAELEDVYLLLAGSEKDTSYTDELKNLIKDLQIESRVILAGSVSNVNELLNISDVFVLPTSRLNGHEEGCPVSLLEAMSVGVPAIASNVAGNRDLIKHKQTGLLFEPGNLIHLKSCLETYFNDTAFARQMAENAHKKILTEHTLRMEADAFANLYKSIKR